MQDESRCHTVNQNNEHCAVDPLPHTIHPGCTEVLPGVGCHGRADALHRNGQQTLGLACCGDGGNGGTAQHIDRPLHDDAANGRDAALQTHGYTDAQQTGAGLFAVGKVRFLHLQHIKFTAQIDKAQHTGNDLRDVGGQRRPQNTHLKRDDEQKVEPDVERTGQDQKVQRRFAIAQCAHDGCHHVVQKDERDSRKDPADIDDSTVKDVRGRLHQLHHGARQRHGRHGQHHAARNAKPRGVGHMAAQITVIPRAEQLRDRDRKAVADANDKAEDQIVDRPGRADRGQRTDTAEAADDDGVRQRIELLEEVAQHQRQRKHQNNFERTAAREVFRHDFPYPIIYVQNFVRIVL